MVGSLVLRRLSFPLALFALLAAPAAAQAIITRTLPPPWVNVMHGGIGMTMLVGTPGEDSMDDFPGGDRDVLVDGPGGADGLCDSLNASDGDNDDTIIAGPEDYIDADAGDAILILSPVDNTLVLFHGTFKDYERSRAILRWLRVGCRRFSPRSRRCYRRACRRPSGRRCSRRCPRSLPQWSS